MKKFLALLAVVASFAFSSTAFAQHHHNGNGGVNVQVSPWGTSLNIGGRNGVTITDRYGWNGGHRGWDNRGWDRGYRGYRPPVVIIPVPRRDYYYDRDYRYDRYDRPVVTTRPYYYFDANDREVYVDQYGRARYTGYIRGDRGCGCN